MAVSSNIFSQQTKAVSDKRNLFTVEIPESWVAASEAKSIINLMYIVDPEYLDEKLSITAVSAPQNLEGSYKINKKALKDFKKFEILEEGEGKINDQDCMWFICTWETKEGDKMKGKQYTLKYEGKNFCIQYHVKESRFDTVKEPYEKIISSLKLAEK
jgi:hypothetical protein